MAQQYAPQYKAIQDALYPELANLDKALVNQAATGISADLPDALKRQYQDQFRAEIGDNNGSGIGADYVSRNMVAAGEQYRNYYQNMALTLTGRQPLYQATPGGYQQNFNAAQNFNYGTTSAFQGQAYGNYSNAYSSMYGTNAQFAADRYKSNMNMVGSIVGSGATFFGKPPVG